MTVHNLVTQDRDLETIDVLTNLLEKAGRGEIRDIVIVCSVNDLEGNGYLRHAIYKDRWRLLGAIEYAKSAVLHEGQCEWPRQTSNTQSRHSVRR